MSEGSAPETCNRRPPAVRVLLLAAFLGLAAHTLHGLGVGGSGLDSVFNDWVYNGVFAAAAAACLARGLLRAPERAAWIAIGAGLASWAAGDIYWTLELSGLESVPYPSLADALYLGFYPLAYAGILLLVRARVPRFRPSLSLDGVIGALAVTAFGTAVLQPVIRDATGGDAATVATNLAYPLGDVLLLSFVVGAVALTGWRPGRSWALLGAGLASQAVADSVFLYQAATGSYVEGTVLDSLWLVGACLIASAAWCSEQRTEPLRLEGLRLLAMPACFALSAVMLQLYGQLEPLGGLPMALATATLVAVILRMLVSFSENLRHLTEARTESMTDPLTGLANRRRLLHDLTLATDRKRGGGSNVFVMFDLDGFKAYNDAFGHQAGDALLARLGRNLTSAVHPHGRAYRLGGDEFCVLARTAAATPGWIVAVAAAALSEEGEAFSVENSRGVVLVPDEADDPSTALRIADRRMYALKSRRPRSAESQTRNVLLRVLREREPGLAEHFESVARFAVALGQSLGMEAEELDEVARAAELHDIGKMAIPEEILHKPGPLTELEMDLIRKHTIIGERILAAAPAMAPVGRLVRASHERWDGRGYPDGLAGEDIPLGARIVTICDAFATMTAKRPYRGAMSAEEALAELRQGSGSQFDPRLVEEFCERVFPALEATLAVEGHGGPMAAEALETRL
jgi:two-component system cell cycle response regulator